MLALASTGLAQCGYDRTGKGRHATRFPVWPMDWLKLVFGGAPTPPAEPAGPTPRSAAPPPAQPSSKTLIEVKRLILPDGVEPQIIEALQRGAGDPDDKWTRKGRPCAYGAFFHRVVGESFQNASGKSRQAILAKAEVGRSVYFMPDPDDPHDPRLSEHTSTWATTPGRKLDTYRGATS